MLETERDEIIQYGIEREKIILVSIAIILGLGCVFDIFYLSIIFSLAFFSIANIASIASANVGIELLCSRA